MCFSKLIVCFESCPNESVVHTQCSFPMQTEVFLKKAYPFPFIYSSKVFVSKDRLKDESVVTCFSFSVTNLVYNSLMDVNRGFKNLLLHLSIGLLNFSGPHSRMVFLVELMVSRN